jgi:hypothetical protein
MVDLGLNVLGGEDSECMCDSMRCRQTWKEQNMRTRASVPIALFSLLLVVIALAGCELVPTVTAIKFENNGNDDIKVLIDGVSNGYVSAGDSKTFNVTPGPHLVMLTWPNGKNACTPSAPSVTKGSTYVLRCSAHH